MLAKGIEPSTIRLQVGRSTIELHQRNRQLLTRHPNWSKYLAALYQINHFSANALRIRTRADHSLSSGLPTSAYTYLHAGLTAYQIFRFLLKINNRSRFGETWRLRRQGLLRSGCKMRLEKRGQTYSFLDLGRGALNIYLLGLETPAEHQAFTTFFEFLAGSA